MPCKPHQRRKPTLARIGLPIAWFGVACATLLHAQVALPPPPPADKTAQTAQAIPPGNDAPVSSHNRDRAQQLFQKGARQIAESHLAAAEGFFTQAVALNPGNRDYEAALAIARDNLATQLMQQALKARMLGDNATWHTLMLEAAAKDSRNPLVLEHARELEDQAESPTAVLETATVAPADPTHEAGPVPELAPQPGRHSFQLRLPTAALVRQVLAAYGVNAVIDTSVKSDPVPFSADDIDFAQAEQMLNLATDTFLVPLDPQRALVALDSKENRGKYERLSLETIYLPGLTPNELSDIANIARNVFNAQQATVHESNNTMTVRAPVQAMNAFNLEITEMLRGRSETTIDVDMYEVQRDHMVNEGAQLPNTTTLFNVSSEVQTIIANNQSLVQQIIASGLASPGNIEEIAIALILSGQAGSSILSQPFAYFGGGLTTTGLTLTSALANNLLNVSDTRMVDQMQLRLLDQEEGTLKIGERYPIVMSSYSNLASGSTGIPGINSAGLSNTLQNLGINLSSLNNSANQTIPQVQYEDIGLNLTATPRIGMGNEITLKLQFQLSSLSGVMLNSNPVINNRQADSIIRVKPGEKAVLVSQLTQQETHTLIGIPLLSEIPGFALPTNREVDKNSDCLVIIITPHVVRLTHTSTEGQLVLLPTHS